MGRGGRKEKRRERRRREGISREVEREEGEKKRREEGMEEWRESGKEEMLLQIKEFNGI